MSFAKFASATSPLSYRPDVPKEEKPKRTFKEPYLVGSVLRVTSLPGDATERYSGYAVGDTFVVYDVDPSFAPEQHGEYFYVNDYGDGLWSNYVECIEE